MGASRESRESEKTLTYIWSLLPHLQVTVWHPLSEDAIEYATDIMTKMGKLIEQLKEEKAVVDKEKYKNMDKTIHEPKKFPLDIKEMVVRTLVKWKLGKDATPKTFGDIGEEIRKEIYKSELQGGIGSPFR